MTDQKDKYSRLLLDLPPPDTTRWVKSRKMAVVEAVRQGALTDEEACSRYNLSPEELTSWKSLLRQFGPDALRTTHLNEYRASKKPTEGPHLGDNTPS